MPEYTGESYFYLSSAFIQLSGFLPPIMCFSSQHAQKKHYTQLTKRELLWRQMSDMTEVTQELCLRKELDLECSQQGLSTV